MEWWKKGAKSKALLYNVISYNILEWKAFKFFLKKEKKRNT